MAITLGLALAAVWASADSGTELLDAAAKGLTAKVEQLLAKGASLGAKDKNGRTALMLAAQHGHAETVRALLEKGASADDRDARGYTAYGLAVFSSTGPRAGIDEVLTALPQPPRPHWVVATAWSAAGLYSSCFLRPEQLVQQIGGIQLDAIALVDFRRFAASSGKGLMEIVRAESHGVAKVPDDDAFQDADAVLALEVKPVAACVPQETYDNLSLTVEAQLVRTRDRAVVWKKAYGGGLAGLHARRVTSPSQYLPVYDEWTKSHAEQVYGDAVEAWYRLKP
ncbi:MAG: ankyrin repeat domain-containing protein [Bryobacteraceae bacterium]|jgi:hypothetical protein